MVFNLKSGSCSKTTSVKQSTVLTTSKITNGLCRSMIWNGQTTTKLRIGEYLIYCCGANSIFYNHIAFSECDTAVSISTLQERCLVLLYQPHLNKRLMWNSITLKQTFSTATVERGAWNAILSAVQYNLVLSANKPLCLTHRGPHLYRKGLIKEFVCLGK